MVPARVHFVLKPIEYVAILYRPIASVRVAVSPWRVISAAAIHPATMEALR